MLNLPNLLDVVAAILFYGHADLDMVLLDFVQLFLVGLLCLFYFLLQLNDTLATLALFFLRLAGNYLERCNILESACKVHHLFLCLVVLSRFASKDLLPFRFPLPPALLHSMLALTTRNRVLCLRFVQ